MVATLTGILGVNWGYLCLDASLKVGMNRSTEFKKKTKTSVAWKPTDC
jgi:hypothetical protein